MTAFEIVENTLEKGEIARYEQFLLSHSVFKSLTLQTHKNQGLLRKGLKNIPSFDPHLTRSQTSPLVLMNSRKDMNNVSCRCDMTEILLKAVKNTIQPTNQTSSGFYKSAVKVF